MARDEPIRILRVIARLNVGGPALHVSYLSRGLDELGYETTLATGNVGDEEGSMEYVAEQLGVVPVFIPDLQREISARADGPAVAHLRSLIRELKPDILHTHTAKAGAVGRLAAVLSGADRPPVIVHTFHGHTLRGYFNPFKTSVFRQVETRLARVTDALIAVSPEVRDDLIKLGIAPPEKIEVIRLGLDLESRLESQPDAHDAIRAELGVPTDRLLIGWLGRMTEIKRVDRLIRAFEIARRAGADADLVLVGDGPLRDEYEGLAAACGVADRTHFVGYRSDVGNLYGAFDIVALTSANEGTPVTIIEAQAAGRPVVVTAVGGTPDVVKDGETGFLVPEDDIDAIANRLTELVNDDELRHRLGENARRRVGDAYSVDRLVRDVDSLYRSLLGQAPPRQARSAGKPIPHVLSEQTMQKARVSPPARSLRIILFSQYFPPEVGATQTRMQAFAEYLSARGHRVTVICEFPNHPQGVIPDEYRHRIIDDDRSNPYRVLRVWVKANQHKTQRSRMAFYLSYMGLATAVAPLAGRADVVFATSPPLFTGAAGLAVARLNGAPFVLDVRDLWPAAAVSLNQISNGSAVRAAEALERLLYAQAAQVIAVTRPFCRYIEDTADVRREPVLIPNGTLESFFFDGDRDAELRRSLAPDSAFLVTFAGTHGIAQALPTILDSAEKTGDSVHFALVGDGPIKESLIQEAARRRIANVSFHPQQPLEAIPPVLAASDALLVPLAADPVFADFVPSKMIDFMASGRPILLSAAGEPARLLEHARAGVAVPPESSDELAQAALWLATHRAEATEMGRRGRLFARRYLRSDQAQRLEQVLLDVTARR